jgi:hypothetical protein
MQYHALANIDSSVPNMDFDIMRDTLEEVDNRAYFDFLHCTPDEDRNRDGLMAYLQNEEPALFYCFENITEAYQNAYFSVLRQRNALLDSYRLFRTAQNTLYDVENIKLVDKVEEQVAGEKPAEGKKRRPKKNPDEEVREKAQAVEMTKRAKILLKTPENDFLSQEKFSTDFPFKQFVQVVKKGKNRVNLTELNENSGWETIYHVNGAWQAEQLVEKLKSLGKKCMTIKRIRSGMDQEVFSYKVLCSK